MFGNSCTVSFISAALNNSTNLAGSDAVQCSREMHYSAQLDQCPALQVQKPVASVAAQWSSSAHVLSSTQWPSYTESIFLECGCCICKQVFQAQLQHCKLLVLAFVQQVQLDLLSFHARCILLGLMLATIQITWLSPDPDTESVDEECR